MQPIIVDAWQLLSAKIPNKWEGPRIKNSVRFQLPVETLDKWEARLVKSIQAWFAEGLLLDDSH